MTTLHKLRAKLSSAQEIHGLEWADLLPQASFAKVLQVEQKRTERSRNPFLLMLLDLGQALAGPD